MSYNTALPDEYLDKMFSDWQNAIAHKEVCTIICPPFSGREYRIANFIKWLDNQKIEIHHVHLTLAQISDPKEIEQLFTNTTRPLLLSPAEVLLSQNAGAMLSALTHYKQKYHRSVVLFFEGTSIITLQKLPHYLTNKIFQNVSYLPYLTFQNSSHFINHLAQRWNINISNINHQEIFKFTGGQMWLIKEIVRQLSEGASSLQQILKTQELQYKTQKIWETFPNTHKKLIAKIANNQRPEISQAPIVLELQQLGILNSNRTILPEFLYEFKHKNLINITYTDTDIFFNKVPVTSFFSTKEQIILRTLLQSTQQKVSRPQLANQIWSSESDYSDWALDKAISRLRNKLAKLGLPKHNLVTIREFGYQLVLESQYHEN